MEKNDLSCEPMDIDLSGQSLMDMDISYSSDIIDNNISLRSSSRISNFSKDKLQYNASLEYKTNIKYCPIYKKRSTGNFKNFVYKLLIVALVTLISIITYHMHSLQCCDQLNINLLRETLSNNVYGQSTAVNLLIETLELNGKTKILFFTGGTGVGKTYVSSLLLNNIGLCSNTYHYTMPTFESMFSLDVMFGLTMCKRSFVVVDDMNMNNMYVIDQIKHLIKKSENLDKDVTVILIYNNNCNNYLYLEDSVLNCDRFNAKLLADFSDNQALKKIIQFEPLSIKDLEQCVTHELGKNRLNSSQFEAVMKNFNVSIDGCKGVHSKMKYLNFL